MSRRHADTVEVVRRDDDPEQFLWRGRLYLVREVLARWSEAGAWWESPRARVLTVGDGAVGGPEDLVTAPIPASPQWAQRAWGEPAPDVGAAVGPASLEDQERELWRVEAGSGRTGGTGVYDLCFDGTGNRWSLFRVLD